MVSVSLWLFFVGVAKDCDFSSTVTFISNMFVECGLDTGLVSMITYVVSLTDVLEWNMNLWFKIFYVQHQCFQHTYHDK